MFSTNVSTNYVLNTAKTSLSSLSIAKGNDLEQYISAQKTFTHAIANNGEVIKACQEYKNSGKFDAQLQESIKNMLGQAEADSNNLYENLFVTVGSEGFADCLGNATLHNVGEEPFYAECLSKGYFFGNNVSPVTGNPVYVIAYAVKDPATGEVIGSVNNSIVGLVENVNKEARRHASSKKILIQLT